MIGARIEALVALRRVRFRDAKFKACKRHVRLRLLPLAAKICSRKHQAMPMRLNKLPNMVKSNTQHV